MELWADFLLDQLFNSPQVPRFTQTTCKLASTYCIHDFNYMGKNRRLWNLNLTPKKNMEMCHWCFFSFFFRIPFWRFCQNRKTLNLPCFFHLISRIHLTCFLHGSAWWSTWLWRENSFGIGNQWWLYLMYVSINYVYLYVCIISLCMYLKMYVSGII